MIEKLYNLKKTQTDQKVMQKAQLQSKLEQIDAEVLFTQNKINTASLDKLGSISDFSILEIHKNTMKLHIVKLQNEKNSLFSQIELINKDIVELQKETEQFLYILEEEKKEILKKLILAEEEASSEYMQSKWIKG